MTAYKFRAECFIDVVRVHGHEYRVMPDMQIAKNRWPVGTYVPIKNFTSAMLAKREAMWVLRSMPTCQP
jgi:hypothetical protein